MITISFDETHHLKNGKPLYATRYTKVMSFHDDIAPVEDNDQAFFINISNKIQFDRVFRKAYGFYEGIASVCDDSGWFHIDRNGHEIYTKRFAWVGNFQEGLCAVRDFNNNYFHINTNGNRPYLENYNYVGDFKYSIAVVTNHEGKATHIDKAGILIHNKFFDELDIYHKSYAIAKDKNGYFHINKQGDELYQDRYQKLEPFYNAAALATKHNNQKIIIEEKTLDALYITEEAIDKNRILDESFGYFKYQILFAILKLDILKNLQNNVNINLPTVSKKIIFRWLYVENIIDKNYTLTIKGDILENELKPLILYWQDLPFKVSTRLINSLKSGNEVFSQIYKKPFFEYLQDNKSLQEITFKLNAYYTNDYSDLIQKLNLSNETVCDIGGKNGSLLSLIKQLNHNITTILADKFQTTTDHTFIPINFFQPFYIQSDVFIVSRVLHDWDDEHAIKILLNIAHNMSRKSTLYLFETIVPNYSSIDKGHTLSFHLLSFLGGYERSLDDFDTIITSAHLKRVNVYSSNNLISVIKIIK